MTDETAGPRIVVLEHDPADPPSLLGSWLTDAGADVTVRRLHAGDEVPQDPQEWSGIVCLGGQIGVHDDDLAPWLPDTRRLLASAVAAAVPTLGIGLGAQLLAVATGGRVDHGATGAEIGAYLVAKRDVTEFDMVFGEIPITPDVMQFHQDAITALPRGAVLMLSAVDYPIQAFRVGSAAWGMQFHIETTARQLRQWRDGGPDGTPGRVISPDDRARSERRVGPMLDEAETIMRDVWQLFARRFVAVARNGMPETPPGWAGPRLPAIGPAETG